MGARDQEAMSTQTEDTLIVVKPDGVKKGLVGEIIRRFERKGFVVKRLQMQIMSESLAEEFYSVHKDKPFFGELVSFITSAPTLALVLEGEGAIAVVRSTMGSTNPADSPPGTIRGDLALSMPDNLVHGSDSPASARREIALWFSRRELV